MSYSIYVVLGLLVLMAILLAVAVFLLVKVIKSRKEYRDTELPEIIIEHKTGKNKRKKDKELPVPASMPLDSLPDLDFGDSDGAKPNVEKTAENQGKVEVEKAEDLAGFEGVDIFGAETGEKLSETNENSESLENNENPIIPENKGILDSAPSIPVSMSTVIENEKFDPVPEFTEFEEFDGILEPLDETGENLENKRKTEAKDLSNPLDLF